MDVDTHARFKAIIANMEKSGMDYAEKKGRAWQSEELKGAILAQEMQKLPADWPLNRKESHAKMSEGYRKYLEETAAAITAEGRAKAIYERWKAEFEAMRSLTSLEKSTRQYT